MVKLIDVAREAGVSPATVSRVLNDSVLVTEEKRRLVLDAVEKLGYVPLRPLATDRAEKVEKAAKNAYIDKKKFIICAYRQISEMLYSGLFWTARELGYLLLSVTASEDQMLDAEHFIQTVQTLKQDDLLAGVLLCSNILPHSAPVIEVLNSIPVVQLEKHLPLESSAVASVEDQQMTYEAVKYLLACGKTHPVLFVSSTHADAPSYVQRRIWGYRLAMMEQGGTFSLVRPADATLEGGIEATNALLSSGHQIDAILCSSDTTAMGCIKALQSHGYRIPEQVAVLGMEDSGVGLYTTPELSTIAPPQVVAGIASIRLLDRLITGSVEPGYIAPIPHQLIIRGSSPDSPGNPIHQWQEGKWVETKHG